MLYLNTNGFKLRPFLCFQHSLQVPESKQEEAALVSKPRTQAPRVWTPLSLGQPQGFDEDQTERVHRLSTWRIKLLQTWREIFILLASSPYSNESIKPTLQVKAEGKLDTGTMDTQSCPPGENPAQWTCGHCWPSTLLPHPEDEL